MVGSLGSLYPFGLGTRTSSAAPWSSIRPTPTSPGVVVTLRNHSESAGTAVVGKDVHGGLLLNGRGVVCARGSCGAGDGSRTCMASLEGRGTIKGLTCANADLGIWARMGRK
jgi:hypothetical protein